MTQEAVQVTTTPPLPGLQLVQTINGALETLGTDFAGSVDPSAIAWPYSCWADTGTGTLKRRNAANSAWVIEARLLRAHLPMYAQGDVPSTDIGPIYIIGKGPAEWKTSVYVALFPTLDAQQWLGTPIGGYITPYAAPPTDDPRFRYILCTAGETGSGDYNEGILINESVSGSAPLIEATAEIDLSGSPMDGQTVHLINTEERFIGAAEAQRVQDDAIQNVIGEAGPFLRLGSAVESGVLSTRDVGSSTRGTTSGATQGTVLIDLSSGARTDTYTRPRSLMLLHYMRIL